MFEVWASPAIAGRALVLRDGAAPKAASPPFGLRSLTREASASIPPTDLPST